ncbi:ABC transporter permease [Ferrovibrio xuzhouensis]|uniref:ABC transporter permease n=1 Tax=Ferrovibrio xuzhouensis TaxID=1576914 RepID=A0ABV7VBV1_9PROT
MAIIALAVLWEVASWFFPPFLFPPLGSIARIYVEIVTTWADFANAGATGLRILAGMTGAFVLGSIIAVLMAKYNRFYDYLFPILNFNQGIPALSWVVFAIIWFHGIEFRIFFIMVMTTLPAFTFQILDAIRSIPKDLMEMSQSFRPSRLDLLRTMILPATVPGILTAWKVNIGNASRVVVVAELVGATGGVGYALMEQQQNFDMAGAIAWTLVLVTFVLVMQFIISQLEAWLLRYRPQSERTL